MSINVNLLMGNKPAAAAAANSVTWSVYSETGADGQTDSTDLAHTQLAPFAFQFAPHRTAA